MSELTLPDAARSNNFKQLERCSRINSECKYILVLVQISVKCTRRALCDDRQPRFLLGPWHGVDFTTSDVRFGSIAAIHPCP